MKNEELEQRGRSASSMEDLIELAGVRGPWSWFILSIASTIGIELAFQGLSYQFLGAKPDHWCLVEPLVETNWTQEQILEVAIPFSSDTGELESCMMYDLNYSSVAELGYNATLGNLNFVRSENTSVTSCSKRFFNMTDFEPTVVTEWDLVCENLPLYSTVQSITQIGNLLGSLIFGYLLDVFGRRSMTIACMLLASVLKVISLFSPNVYFYIALRGLSSTFLMGSYMANFILALEACSPSQRSTVASLYIIPWSFGYMALAGIAYCFHDWRELHIALSVPLVIFFFLYWILPESPRWLILHGQYTKALKVLNRAAYINKQQLPAGTTILASMEKIAQREHAENMSSKIKTKNIVRDSVYRLRLIFLIIAWFACGIVYYGISLNAVTLSANVYIYIFLGGLLEVPVYILLWFWLSFRGRRILQASLFLICGICIAALSILLVLFPGAPVAATVFLSMCGKFGITAAFHLIWIYTAELFPTEYRSQALGCCNVLCRIGSFFAPYFNDILGAYTVWGPSVTYAVLALIAAVVIMFLPDSDGRNLPELDKVSDAENK